MRKFPLIFLTLLTALTVQGCRKGTDTPAQDMASLGIAVDFPESEEGVKSDVGLLPASSIENAIHSLCIWVFRSDDHSLVCAKDIAEEDFPVGGGIHRYSLPVTKEFVQAMPPVDVFVLANAASVGAEFDEESDWESLNNAFFADSDLVPYYGFGIGKPVRAVDENLGLPMSACGKNLNIEGEDPVLKIRTLKLLRTVSRLRFVFCKTHTEGDNEEEVAIKRIILGGYQIPLKEYLFTTASSGVVQEEPVLRDNYSDVSYIIPGPDEIAENDTPENLIYVNQDPLTYERIINDAVQENQLTDLGITYFRESDRRLNGRIEYTINGQERTREFNMMTAGDFSRNHSWTVFGYFLGGRNLQLALNVTPWDYNAFVVDFSEESVNVSSKFTVEESTADITPTGHGQYDVHLLPGIAAKGHLHITTPVGGRLMIRPIGDASAFQIIPDIAVIDPTANSGRIDILIRRNPDVDEDLSGKFITLSFMVETGERVIDANTEVVDAVYRFIL